jgi:tRNA (guanine26-N2/guanine27-N2)-dimethyltransferase
MDRTIVHKVAGDLVERNFKLGQQELVLLNRCAEEADGPPAFYDVHEVARRAGVSPPKIVELIAKLREGGYFASRTHFSGTGFRTDAPMEELVKIFKCA